MMISKKLKEKNMKGNMCLYIWWPCGGREEIAAWLYTRIWDVKVNCSFGLTTEIRFSRIENLQIDLHIFENLVFTSLGSKEWII